MYGSGLTTALGAHSLLVNCLHWLHLVPTHLVLVLRVGIGVFRFLVDGIQVEKVARTSQSKSGNVWI
jgi:hypothetical protein